MVKRVWRAVAFLVLLGLAIPGCSDGSGGAGGAAGQVRYEPGQVWSYRTRPGEEASTITVLKVEDSRKAGVIVHVAVTGLAIHNPDVPDGVAELIPHLPFTHRAIDESVVELKRSGVGLPDYQDGYDKWRRRFDSNQAGVFAITVAGAVANIEQTWARKRGSNPHKK